MGICARGLHVSSRTAHIAVVVAGDESHNARGEWRAAPRAQRLLLFAALLLALAAGPAFAQGETDAALIAEMQAFAVPSTDACFPDPHFTNNFFAPVPLAGFGYVRDTHADLNPDFMYSSLWFFAAPGCWGDGLPFPNSRPLNVTMRTAKRDVCTDGKCWPKGSQWMKYTAPRAPCPSVDDGGYGCPYLGWFLWRVAPTPPPPPPPPPPCYFTGHNVCP